MTRRLLPGIVLAGAASVGLFSGCAEQLDETAPMTSPDAGDNGGQSGAAMAGNGGDANVVPMATAGSSNAGSGGKSDDGVAGTPASGGTESSSGGVANGGAAGRAGASGMPACAAPGDCDDKNPCTTDACLMGKCSYTSNTEKCADDGDPCTDDLCGTGTCKHPDNKTCACKSDKDCDDQNGCTNDKCDANQCTHTNNTAACADDGMACTQDVCAGGACTHKNNGTCGAGTAFVVDNFNSSADFTANKTTPNQRALVVTDVDSTNLEGDADLYVAEAGAGSIELGLASMTGLSKLRIAINSQQASTAGMIFVGLWNGATWSEKPLSNYGAVPTTPAFATLDVVVTDFGQQLANVTKMRLRFAVTGGEKVWRIDDISAAK